MRTIPVPSKSALVASLVLLVPWSSAACAPRRPLLGDEELERLARGEPLAPAATTAGADSPTFTPRTRLAIDRALWRINGEVTYLGTRAEGLLLNVRAVHATFEDRNPETKPADFDPEGNVGSFIAKIPAYASQGVRAFSLNLQGGDPGYKGALNSAFEPDGALRKESARRFERVIEACDRAGVAVIVGCFHHLQDQVLRDDDAVKKAVGEAAAWIKSRGYENVCLEIADEHAHEGYDRGIIKGPNGIKELLRIVRQVHPGLLVSSSGMGGGRLAHQIAVDADFLLLHFQQVPVAEVLERVASADKLSKAIVCNADAKTAEEGAQALEAAVNALCSWGYANAARNEKYPFKFEGAADDPIVYAKLKELTTPGN
jgi:hypothetical protein